MVGSRRGFCVALLLAPLAGSGCWPGVNWYETRRVPGYVVPPKIAIVVDASDAALAADHGGYIGTMALTIREELAERGVESTILDPKPSRLPSPRVEVIVRDFTEGDATESHLTGLVLMVPLGQGEIGVLCRAYSATNALMFEGTLKGSIAGDANQMHLAEAAGAAIAKALTDPEGARHRKKRNF
jgi:hypothetical protein